MASISLAIAARGTCDARRMWDRLRSWPAMDTHLAYDDETVLAGKPDWIVAHHCESGSIFRYWGEAIANCQGDYVAVLSPYLVPCEAWLDAMAAAAVSGERAYFGPVEENYAKEDRAIVGYLVEYGHFHRPFRAEHREIPGSNLLVKSSQLPPRETLRKQGFTKTALLNDWNKHGYRPTLVEAAVAFHDRFFDASGYRKRRYSHGRAYGVSRRKGLGWVGVLVSLAKTILLPGLRTWRILMRVRHVAHLDQTARRHIWAILASEAAWSVGEFVGLATGNPGDVERLD